jgi:hypothetical protein
VFAAAMQDRLDRLNAKLEADARAAKQMGLRGHDDQANDLSTTRGAPQVSPIGDPLDRVASASRFVHNEALPARRHREHVRCA